MDLKYAGRMKSLNPNAAVPGCIERVKEPTKKHSNRDQNPCPAR